MEIEAGMRPNPLKRSGDTDATLLDADASGPNADAPAVTPVAASSAAHGSTLPFSTTIGALARAWFRFFHFLLQYSCTAVLL